MGFLVLATISSFVAAMLVGWFLLQVALGDRFGLFIQALNNAQKLFIQIIHSIEKRIIAHLVMGDRFGLFIQTLNNA